MDSTIIKKLLFLTIILFPNFVLAQNDSLQIIGSLKKQGDYKEVKKASLSFINAQGERKYLGADIENGEFILVVPKQKLLTDGILNVGGNNLNSGANRPLNLFFK